jgi:Kef-type K+ transport system membrane component KefB
VRTLADGRVLALGSALVAVGIVGKVAAGYAPWWFRGRKLLVGVAMVPRGEVGLIFAGMGLSAGVFAAGEYAAVMMMVLVTTLAVPPALRALGRRGPRSLGEPGGVAELSTEA